MSQSYSEEFLACFFYSTGLQPGEKGVRRRDGDNNNASLRARSREGGEEQQAATSHTAQGKETEPNVQLSLFLLQIVKIEKVNRIRTTAHSVLFSIQTWS